MFPPEDGEGGFQEEARVPMPRCRCLGCGDGEGGGGWRAFVLFDGGRRLYETLVMLGGCVWWVEWEGRSLGVEGEISNLEGKVLGENFGWTWWAHFRGVDLAGEVKGDVYVPIKVSERA